MADPCNCAVLCPHDFRCLGGHANYPDSHWYMCDTCTPKRRLSLNEVLAERRGLRERTEEHT